jgi:hypothetical protein
MTRLKPLQKELLIFIICLLLAGTVVFISYSTLQTARENLSVQQQTLDAAKARYYLAVENKALLDKFSGRYAELPEKNIVGEENRLSWVDAIETTAKQLKLPHLKYRIEKRQALDAPPLKQSFPGIDVFFSSMTLEMQLLHEGDLYRFIDRLQNRASGLFNVEHCAMKKNSTLHVSVLQSGTDKNFSTACVLHWYTLQPASNSKPSLNNRRSR